MLNVKITGSGYYLPPKIETAEAVSNKINKSTDWIISSTGVKERRISDIDVDQMAAIACKGAIGNSSQPDLIINASGVPKQTIPDTSVFIQKELGYSGIPSFSIHSTCLSFLTALIVNLISSCKCSCGALKVVIFSEIWANIESILDKMRRPATLNTKILSISVVFEPIFI